MLKKITRLIIILLKCVCAIFGALVTAIALTGLYQAFNGLWGLFLFICASGLLVASIATAVVSFISLEEWLESED